MSDVSQHPLWLKFQGGSGTLLGHSSLNYGAAVSVYVRDMETSPDTVYSNFYICNSASISNECGLAGRPNIPEMHWINLEFITE